MTEYKTNSKNKKLAVSGIDDNDIDQVIKNAVQFYRNLFREELFFKITVRMGHYSDDDPLRQRAVVLIEPDKKS